MDPLISIIIPSYNAREYVREAVDSALAQTYPACEVIVVDDGSTDDTKSILDSYIQEKKIQYIYQGNKGLAGARNTGIRAAKGDFIAFLDSDDIFLPEKVAAQIDAFRGHPDFGVCYSDVLPCPDLSSSPEAGALAGGAGAVSRTFYHHRYRYPSGNVFEPLLHRQFINPLAVMVRRTVCDRFGIFDETLRRSEDWELWLRWARAGVKFLYLDRVLAHYRVRADGNLSSVESEPEMKERNLEFFSRLGEKLTPAEWEKFHFTDILRRLQIKVVFAYLLNGRKHEALQKAEHLAVYWRWIASSLSAGSWKWLLARTRSFKHHFLLKKYKL